MATYDVKKAWAINTKIQSLFDALRRDETLYRRYQMEQMLDEGQPSIGIRYRQEDRLITVIHTADKHWEEIMSDFGRQIISKPYEFTAIVEREVRGKVYNKKVKVSIYENIKAVEETNRKNQCLVFTESDITYLVAGAYSDILAYINQNQRENQQLFGKVVGFQFEH